MERDLVTNKLTHGEELLINLVNAIKAKSQANHNEGLPEDKRLDQWGTTLVNSEEYIVAVGKIKASQTTDPFVVDEID